MVTTQQLVEGLQKLIHQYDCGPNKIASIELIGDDQIRVLGTYGNGDVLDCKITMGPSIEESDVPTGEITETQRQGVDERVARKVRVKKVTPRTKNIDATPHRPANNDPTKTSVGKAAVRRQGKRNKAHPERFAENKIVSTAFIEAAINATRGQIVKMAESINPISESIAIRKAVEQYGDGDGKLSKIDEIIHNVWGDTLIVEYAGIAVDKQSDLTTFDNAASILNEMNNWGVEFCWIERIRNNNANIYKVYGDTTPSKTYSEHKGLSDRDLILSGDRANIIQIIYGA